MASINRFFLFPVLLLYLAVALSSCGDSPTRYNPGTPSQVTGLVVTAAGKGEVGLSWPASTSAAGGYDIYYSTSPGVTKSNGTSFAITPSTSTIVTGLNPGTTYYFVITSVTSLSPLTEGPESNEVSAVPAVPTPAGQNDLEGTWNFNVLVSGASPGWMRGRLAVSNAGNIPGIVTYTEFSDSSGNTSPPAGFFNTLQWDDASAMVRDASGQYNGFISGNLYRDMIVLTTSAGAASPMLVILQKQVPNITFDAATDLAGGLGGGSGFNARSFIYNQISAGNAPEWEIASGRINRTLQINYSVSNSDPSSNIFIPPNQKKLVSDRASFLDMSSDGIVTETANTAVTPAPTAVIDRGVMSADKTIIVGTATDNSGSSPRYVLRIYQLLNINLVTNLTDPLSQSHTFAQSDMAGTYNYEKLFVGTATGTASGSFSIDSAGAVSPDGITLLMDVSPDPGTGIAVDARYGVLSNASNLYFHGKLSYFTNLLVSTNTETDGSFSMSLGFK